TYDDGPRSLHSSPTRRSSDLCASADATMGGATMSGIIGPIDFTAEGVAHALQLAGDTLRLTTATPEQLNAAAAFLANGFARFPEDRKSTRLNSSHVSISYAVF